MRVDFLVDGFNVYHSLKTAQKHLAGASTRWLDLRALLASHLSALPWQPAEMGEVHYFSALATHFERLRPDVVVRHRQYIDAIEATGVRVHLGRFKPASRAPCTSCSHKDERWEEKETDVAISVMLIEVLHTQRADAVCLVTGDTDLVPAIRTAQRLFPRNPITCLFPYLRKNRELVRAAPPGVALAKESYAKYQLPNPAPGRRAKSIPKPANW